MTEPQPLTPVLSKGSCRRCGTCCLKGGPALHHADRELLDSGRIPLESLFTIRQGEPAFDNVAGRCVPVPTDIVKIAGSKDKTRACRYYDRDNGICSIYDHRPLECRTLTCWDSAALEAIYNHDRLTRRDLVASVEGLWELVCDHQTRCGYDRITDLVARLKAAWMPGIVDDLLHLIRYDQSLRQAIRERSHQQARHLDFLFGLPLMETIRRFGLRLVHTPAGITLEWTGPGGG
jgi:Fe-S-cluster containining protein